MKFPFQVLPAEKVLRPVVDVSFPALPDLRIPALVDSGAIKTRFDAEIAEALEIDLDGIETEVFGAALRQYHCRTTVVDLTVGKTTRPCEVAFVEGWARVHGHALLGIRGFFDSYVVRIDAANRTTELRPRRHPNAS